MLTNVHPQTQYFQTHTKKLEITDAHATHPLESNASIRCTHGMRLFSVVLTNGQENLSQASNIKSTSLQGMLKKNMHVVPYKNHIVQEINKKNKKGENSVTHFSICLRRITHLMED